MSLERYLLNIPFDKKAGPVLPGQLGQILKVSNCQRAAQELYYRLFGLALPPESVLSDQTYLNGSSWQSIESECDPSFEILKPGALICAERLRDRQGRIILKDRSSFLDETFWAKSLHVAVYLSTLQVSPNLKEIFPKLNGWPQDSAIIYHASGVSLKTVLWRVDQFKWYYQPVGIRNLP